MLFSVSCEVWGKIMRDIVQLLKAGKIHFPYVGDNSVKVGPLVWECV